MRSSRLHGYSLAILSVAMALGAGLLLDHFGFRDATVPIFIWASAISSCYGGQGPAVFHVIVHEMLTLLQGEAARYSIALRPVFPSKLPKINADRVQLQQVFMNLILNAVEAMKDSSGELTVTSQRRDGQLWFSVSDTDVGLPTENMDQIFSAFYTTKEQGSGMGLAISRTIVESHGGRLWATANGGRGATFHFTLPTQATESALAV